MMTFRFAKCAMKMFAVALPVTFLGLAGCETAGVSNLFGRDNLNFGVGGPANTNQYTAYPLPGGNVLIRARVSF